MAWNDGPLIVYHGTDNGSGNDILAEGADWRRGDPFRDFGRGFYTTTSLPQARDWADVRTIQARRSGRRVNAVVLRFTVPRPRMNGLNVLCFVLPDSNPDYWEFVDYCRAGNAYHRIAGDNYDIVFGPVARNWRRRIAHSRYDQLSFHADTSRAMLQDRELESRGTPLFR